MNCIRFLIVTTIAVWSLLHTNDREMSDSTRKAAQEIRGIRRENDEPLAPAPSDEGIRQQTMSRPPQATPEGPRSPAGADLRLKMREQFLQDLPPEARERFVAAREKALQDPEIQILRSNALNANRELIKATRRKMAEIDPGLIEIAKEQVRDIDRDSEKDMKKGGPTEK